MHPERLLTRHNGLMGTQFERKYLIAFNSKNGYSSYAAHISGYAANFALASRLRLTPCSAAISARLR